MRNIQFYFEMRDEPPPEVDLNELCFVRPPTKELDEAFMVSDDVWPIRHPIPHGRAEIPANVPILHFGMAFSLKGADAYFEKELGIDEPGGLDPQGGGRVKDCGKDIELSMLHTIEGVIKEDSGHMYRVFRPISIKYPYMVSFYMNYTPAYRKAKVKDSKEIKDMVVPLLDSMDIKDRDDELRWWWDRVECGTKFYCWDPRYNVGGEPHPGRIIESDDDDGAYDTGDRNNSQDISTVDDEASGMTRDSDEKDEEYNT